MRNFLIAMLVLSATTVFAQDDELPPDISGSYYCKATASAGVRFDKTDMQWKSALFKTDNEALIVKVRYTGKTGKLDFLDLNYRLYEVRLKQFGEKGDDSVCTDWGGPKEVYPNVRVTGQAVRCSQISYNHWFNFETKKYQSMFDGGYMDKDQNTDTPAVTVGVCDKID